MAHDLLPAPLDARDLTNIDDILAALEASIGAADQIASLSHGPFTRIGDEAAHVVITCKDLRCYSVFVKRS